MYGVGYDYSEYRSDCTSGVSASSDDISKRRGEGNDLSTESGKMSRNSSDWNKSLLFLLYSFVVCCNM
ncbi:hypothetical protein Anas_01122 [Armadillidium nasatum]|uniref:Uncharacterized protein n=1 Tax=Armadillidium nasatum TaxID=96803 RepID=A0A5N5TGY0_9CRUS|nr:hypothetical protein Anas_01122 [Armadillidium nasatum]